MLLLLILPFLVYSDPLPRLEQYLSVTLKEKNLVTFKMLQGSLKKNISKSVDPDIIIKSTLYKFMLELKVPTSGKLSPSKTPDLPQFLAWWYYLLQKDLNYLKILPKGVTELGRRERSRKQLIITENWINYLTTYSPKVIGIWLGPQLLRFLKVLNFRLSLRPKNPATRIIDAKDNKLPVTKKKVDWVPTKKSF